MTTIEQSRNAHDLAAGEVVTHAFTRVVVVPTPGTAGETARVALITLDNGRDHTRPLPAHDLDDARRVPHPHVVLIPLIHPLEQGGCGQGAGLKRLDRHGHPVAPAGLGIAGGLKPVARPNQGEVDVKKDSRGGCH